MLKLGTRSVVAAVICDTSVFGEVMNNAGDPTLNIVACSGWALLDWVKKSRCLHSATTLSGHDTRVFRAPHWVLAGLSHSLDNPSKAVVRSGANGTLTR